MRIIKGLSLYKTKVHLEVSKKELRYISCALEYSSRNCLKEDFHCFKILYENIKNANSKPT